MRTVYTLQFSHLTNDRCPKKSHLGIFQNTPNTFLCQHGFQWLCSFFFLEVTMAWIKYFYCLILFQKMFVYLLQCRCTTCMQVPPKARRGHWVSWNWIKGCCKLLDVGASKLSIGSIQEQPVLLITEPFL